MSHEAAAKIVEMMIRHGAEQNQLLLEIESSCSPDQFYEFKQMIGSSMGAMLLDVINPIIEIYPDLKPSALTE